MSDQPSAQDYEESFSPDCRWQAAEPDVRAHIMSRLLPGFDDETMGRSLSIDLLSPPFFTQHLLVRLSRPTDDAFSGVVYLLHGAQSTHVLDGSGAPFHLAAKAESLRLDSTQRGDYLRCFVFFMRSAGVTFRLLESAEALAPETPDEPEAVARARRALIERIHPLRHTGRRESDDVDQFEALMQYGGPVYRASFEVDATGAVTMLDDTKLDLDVPAGLIRGYRPFCALFELLPELADDPAFAVMEASPRGLRDTPAIARDRAVSLLHASVLLEAALGSASKHALLRRFNAGVKDGPAIRNFARFVLSHWPIVVIESEHPFIEDLVADLIAMHGPGPDKLTVHAGTGDSDGSRLHMLATGSSHAIHLVPMHAYRGIQDVERVAHDLSVNDVIVLVGCESMADVPEPLRRVTDMTLRLPTLDAELLAQLFEAVFGEPLPRSWRRQGTDWVRHVLPADFHQPARQSWPARNALRYIRDRVRERLRGVDPMPGPALADLHGLSEARHVAEDLITDLRAALAGQIPWTAVDRGMLLVGPPGTGKTTLARAIAKEAELRFVVASASAWQSVGHLGDHLRAMRASFAEARRYAPSILFIDEIDTVGNRDRLSGHNAQYGIEVVNALLELISAQDPERPVIVIAASNAPERVDPALRRAGRLDQTIALPYPTVDALASIFNYYLKRTGETQALGDDIDPQALAALSFGLTGADVEFLVRGAARRARRANSPLRQQHLIDEITRRPRRPEDARRLDPDDMLRVATHEAGHALARCLGPRGGRDIMLVSIVPRADGALGFVASAPPAGAMLTRQDYVELIEVALAGRAAEEIRYGPQGVSSGAGGDSDRCDLAIATRLASNLVCRLSMSADLTLSWKAAPGPGEQAQIESLLRDAYASVRNKLRARRSALFALSELLVSRQEIDGEQLRTIMLGMDVSIPMK